MRRIIACAIVAAGVALSAWALAAKTTYVVTNNRFNYVKLREVKAKEAEELRLAHPASISEAGLRAALASVNLSRSYVIKKEVDAQQVFDERAIDFLAPALVRAFAQAGESEIVVFSYLSKNPLFIIRNDRLSICEAWISGDELHLKFQKLYAKLLGDTDKRGGEARLISQARGLRVKLDLGEGQKLGVDDPEEIILSLNYNYVKPPEPEKPVTTEGITMAGESVPLAGTAAAEKGPSGKTAEVKGKAKRGEVQKSSEGAALAASSSAAAAPAPKTVKERLEELKQLRKDGLIDQKEYEAKRKEILQQL